MMNPDCAIATDANANAAASRTIAGFVGVSLRLIG